MKLFNISAKDSTKYFNEVEEKLIEETRYTLELEQSQEIADACRHLPDTLFPNYYPEYSSERILTMDWMDGIHLTDFKPEKDTGNKIGQALWDFYMYQIHTLKKVHADPHPGNFLVSEGNKLIVLDFGCIKEIPEDFSIPYFNLLNNDTLGSKELVEDNMYRLEILKDSDLVSEKEFFLEMFSNLFGVFAKPFNKSSFDFSNKDFFNELASMGKKYSTNPDVRKMNSNRGSKHFIYINRTFFGLYNLLHLLEADNIIIDNIGWRNLKGAE